MKIAVTATGPSLDAEIDPRFGRCAYFLIVETDDMSFEAVKNENATLGGGAGIQSGQLVAEKGAKAVLTGNCGPNAFQALAAASVQIIVGVSGMVRDAVEGFKAGTITATAQPNVQSHFGMGGGGRGMGMGRGMGRAMATEDIAPKLDSPNDMGREESLSVLKEQTRTLKEQMEQLERQIAQLQKE